MAQPVSPMAAMPQMSPPGSPQPVPADPAPDASPAGLGGNRLRPLEVAECSLCGAARPLGLLIPDGGSACDGVRWYCKDVKSCTERWVAARQAPPVRQPSPFGRALAAVPPPVTSHPADAPGGARPIASLEGCPLPALAV
jgi:hypothetical protein